jgi:hypothetical protein
MSVAPAVATTPAPCITITGPMMASCVPGDVSSSNTGVRGVVFGDDAVKRAPAFFARLRADEPALPFPDLDFDAIATCWAS